MSAAVIIQARIGSSRRPGKITYPFQGEPMLEYQVRRLRAGGIDELAIATTDRPGDDVTAALADQLGVPCFRGSEDDVMGRYLACADAFGADPVVRVGGDDPLLDPAGLRALMDSHATDPADLVHASHARGWIYGTAGELVTRDALRRAVAGTSDPLDREHVISFIKKSDLFSKRAISPADASLIRPDIFVSVDYQEDLDLIAQILEIFTQEGRRYDFTQKDLIALFDSGRLEINNRHLHSGF